MKEASSLKPGYIREPLIAALITAISFLVMCVSGSVYPLGKYTILVSDLEAQYAPFLFFWKNHILGLDLSHPIQSLTYSFGMGAGKNIMSTFGYYLASPLNIFVFLFDETWVNQFIEFLMIVKLSAASAFMCLFVHERSSSKDARWPVLFGVMYSFSSFAGAFMFNIMWLDGYALLPLLLFFTERFMVSGRRKGLIFTLLWLFISNYYIAYMVGIGSFFYLIVRMIEEGYFSNFKKAFRKIGVFVLNAICCGLCIGLILIPVGLDTIRNGDPLKEASNGEYVGFSLIDIVDGLFIGTPGEFGDVLPGNLPFVFISLLVTISCVIYFLSPVFSGKKRKIRAVLFALIYLCLAVTFLDNAWQVFDSPNWFWHRESFVFMPLFILCSLEVLEKIKEVDRKDIGKAAVIIFVLLFVAQSFGKMKKADPIFLANIIYICIFFFLLLLLKKEKWHEQLRNMPRIVPMLVAIFTVFEVVAVNTMFSAGIDTLAVHYGEADTYIDSVIVAMDCANASSIVGNGMRHETENVAVRGASIIESNGSYYSGSRGITLFNSASNKSFHRFLKQLGYSVNYNYFAAGYNCSSPDTDAFFSIGTLNTRHPYSLARFVIEDELGVGLSFYINDNVLPVAFPVSSSAYDFDFYSLETDNTDKDYLSFRNSWYNSLFPDTFTEDFFRSVSGVRVTPVNATSVNTADYYTEEGFVSYEEPEDEKDSDSTGNPDTSSLETEDLYKDSKTTLYRINTEIPIILSCDFVAPVSGEYYFNLSAPRVLNEASIYVNGTVINSYAEGSFYSVNERLGTFEAGERVNVSVTSNRPSFVYEGINIAYFDKEAFDEMFAGTDVSNVTVTELTDGYVRLQSNLRSGQRILTTIPYEEGWTLYIDGQKTPIAVYQNALIGIDAGTGEHEIILSFEAPGLKAGAASSILGIIGLAVMGIMSKRKPDKKVRTKVETK